MADYENPTLRQGARADAAIDQGLRTYMLRVYNYMILGMLTTGVAAYALFTLSFTLDPSLAVAEITHSPYYVTEFGSYLFLTPFKYVLMFGPLVFSLLTGSVLMSLSWRTGLAVFLAFALFMGVALSSIFAVFLAVDIVRVFFITAIAFGGLSLWGYTTNRDLSPWRTFLVMGVVGLIAAIGVNKFILESSMLHYAISIIGVLVFGGLTAYHTQQLKGRYFATGGVGELAERYAVDGAYGLYISFINMFLFLLNLLGGRQQ